MPPDTVVNALKKASNGEKPLLNQYTRSFVSYVSFLSSLIKLCFYYFWQQHFVVLVNFFWNFRWQHHDLLLGYLCVKYVTPEFRSFESFYIYKVFFYSNNYDLSLFQGHVRLIQALSKLYSPILKHEVDPMTEVLTTIGAYEALFVAFNGLVNPGDEVLIIEPFFDCYEPMARSVGGVPKFVPLRPVRISTFQFFVKWPEFAYRNALCYLSAKLFKRNVRIEGAYLIFRPRLDRRFPAPIGSWTLKSFAPPSRPKQNCSF